MESIRKQKEAANSVCSSVCSDLEIQTDFRSHNNKNVVRSSGISEFSNAVLEDNNDYRNSRINDDFHDDMETESKFKEFWTGSWAICLGTIVGLSLGFMITSFFSDSITKAHAEWINLPGELFLRSLKCLVVPMIFCSLTVGVADILVIGKASNIAWRMGIAFVLTSIVASLEGITFGMLFKQFFHEMIVPKEEMQSVITVRCLGNSGYMQYSDTGSFITCNTTTVNPEQNNNTIFEVADIFNLFSKKNLQKGKSLSEQIVQLLKEIVPFNITQAFANASLLSIVVFAIFFGFALAKSSPYRGKRGQEKNFGLEIIRQANVVFIILVKWVIAFTPIAIVSLIAGSFAKHGSDGSRIYDVLYFILAFFSGTACHMLLVMPLLFLLTTGVSPKSFFQKIWPAQIFAFGCASSVATLPISMRCMDSTRQVSRSLSRFVLSIGATVNMDGGAMFLALAVVFLAQTTNIALTWIQLVLLAIVATLTSIGGAPIPNASLILVVTVWRIVITDESLPVPFSYLIAIDWLVDRFRTVINITGDMVTARIIASMVDEEYIEDGRHISM